MPCVALLWDHFQSERVVKHPARNGSTFFISGSKKNVTLDSAKLGPVETVLQQFQGYCVHLNKQIPILYLLYQVHSKVYSEVTAELTFLFCQAHS